MKKLLLSLLFACSIANATTNVPIVWPFSPASNQANAMRATIEHANKSQSKYNFIFDNKPGAGGAVSVNYVLNQKTPTLLMTTTSFFVRPVYYPNESYDVDALVPVTVLAIESPIVVLSKNITSVKDLEDRKSVSLGIIAGSITEMIGRNLQKNFNDKIVLVPYQSTIAATRDVLGGHLDMSLEFIKDAIPWIEDGSLKPVGVTGTRSDKTFKSFGSQGITGLTNTVNSFYILASKSMPAELIVEMHEILSTASTQPDVIQIWKNDHAGVSKRSLKETTDFWNKQKDFWIKK